MASVANTPSLEDVTDDTPNLSSTYHCPLLHRAEVTSPTAIFAVVTDASANLVAVTAPLASLSPVTAALLILAVSTALAPSLSVDTAPLAILSVLTESVASFVVVNACVTYFVGHNGCTDDSSASNRGGSQLGDCHRTSTQLVLTYSKCGNVDCAHSTSSQFGSSSDTIPEIHGIHLSIVHHQCVRKAQSPFVILSDVITLLASWVAVMLTALMSTASIVLSIILSDILMSQHCFGFYQVTQRLLSAALPL
jgi:hypothetical protein